MSKIRCNVVLCFILVLSCLFPLISYGNNGSTNIALKIHQITVDAGNHGVYEVDGVKYKGENTFYLATTDNIRIDCNPDLGYKIKSITCDSIDTMMLGSDYVEIKNISDDAIVEFIIRKKSSGGSGNNDVLESTSTEKETESIKESEVIKESESIKESENIKESEMESEFTDETKIFIDDHEDFEDYIITTTTDESSEIIEIKNNDGEENLELIKTDEIDSKEIEKRIIEDIKNNEIDEQVSVYDYKDGQVIISIIGDESEIITNKEEVINAIMTEEDFEKVADGETIELRVQIELHNSEEEYEKIINKKVYNKVNSMIDDSYKKVFLEIKLYKIVGKNNVSSLFSIDNSIELLVTIPLSEFNLTDLDNFLLYSIGDEVHELKDLDSDEETITLKTSNFPTYIVVYSKSELKNGDIITSSNCICYLHWIVLILSIIDILLNYKLKDKKEDLEDDDKELDENNDTELYKDKELEDDNNNEEDKYKRKYIRKILIILISILMLLISIIAIYHYKCYYDIIICLLGYFLSFLTYKFTYRNLNTNNDEEDK